MASLAGRKYATGNQCCTWIQTLSCSCGFIKAWPFRTQEKKFPESGTMTSRPNKFVKIKIVYHKNIMKFQTINYFLINFVISTQGMDISVHMWLDSTLTTSTPLLVPFVPLEGPHFCSQNTFSVTSFWYHFSLPWDLSPGSLSTLGYFK